MTHTQLTTLQEQLAEYSSRSDISRAVWAIEELRLAEARLVRRRQSACGPGHSTREVLRLVVEAADRGEALTPTQLAHATKLCTPSVTSILKKLSGAGLVHVHQAERDRRSKVVEPVDRNDPDATDPVTQHIKAITDGLDPAVADALAKVLERVRDAVDAECAP